MDYTFEYVLEHDNGEISSPEEFFAKAEEMLREILQNGEPA